MHGETARFRLVVAAVLLVATLVFVLVAMSQLFVGSSLDPRDTLGSRAAGFGFSDQAHQTLFGVAPMALPLAAVFVSRHPTVRLTAAVEYVVLILLGAIVAAAAFMFRMDVAQEQFEAAGTVFVTKRAAVESLFYDVTMLALATVAMVVAVRARRRDRADVT